MTNCYYLADSETDSVNGTTYNTAQEFADGGIAYLLQQGNTEPTWTQEIGKDLYPVLSPAIPRHSLSFESRSRIRLAKWSATAAILEKLAECYWQESLYEQKRKLLDFRG